VLYFPIRKGEGGEGSREKGIGRKGHQGRQDVITGGEQKVRGGLVKGKGVPRHKMNWDRLDEKKEKKVLEKKKKGRGGGYRGKQEKEREKNGGGETGSGDGGGGDSDYRSHAQRVVSGRLSGRKWDNVFPPQKAWGEAGTVSPEVGIFHVERARKVKEGNAMAQGGRDQVGAGKYKLRGRGEKEGT